MKIQSRLNSKSLQCLTEDKSVFYLYCAGANIPVPKLHAVMKPPIGWSSEGSVLSGRVQWEKFFEKDLPEEFVIKPANGVYGRSFAVFRKTGQGFLDATGVTRTGAEIYDSLNSNPHYRSFVVQERLRNHPELIRLSQTHSLQTVRINTFIDAEGAAHIVLDADLKVITGNNATDNFDNGRSGNLIAFVCMVSGRLRPAMSVSADGLGTLVFSHPKTEVPFDGFQLPFWNETCLLVKETALKFFPLRTIGWDVALTPNGPVIVEGNIWWDPLNHAPYLQKTKSFFAELGENTC